MHTGTEFGPVGYPDHDGATGQRPEVHSDNELFGRAHETKL
jgi:hypothetical protein